MTDETQGAHAAGEPDAFVPGEMAELVEPVADSAPRTAHTAATALPPLDPVHDVPVTVQAILGRARMRVDALVRLRAGEVIELDRRVGEPVDVLVNGKLIARGEVVVIDGLLGVTLTEIVRRIEQ